MGRKRTTSYGLPPRMNLKGKTYYHVSIDSRRKWTKLGQDLVIAKRLQDGNNQRLIYSILRTRIDSARKTVQVDFQFRDIRAKTATDTGNLVHSQKLLGHKTRLVTEHYTRNRKGDKVSPLK